AASSQGRAPGSQFRVASSSGGSGSSGSGGSGRSGAVEMSMQGGGRRRGR
ncbi:hypothetical protein ICW40_19975, partial [Actinotalea ferrariae]|nr:hypothetical protein [Actinotalea ferrariae]